MAKKPTFRGAPSTSLPGPESAWSTLQIEQIHPGGALGFLDPTIGAVEVGASTPGRSGSTTYVNRESGRRRPVRLRLHASREPASRLPRATDDEVLSA